VSVTLPVTVAFRAGEEVRVKVPDCVKLYYTVHRGGTKRGLVHTRDTVATVSPVDTYRLTKMGFIGHYSLVDDVSICYIPLKSIYETHSTATFITVL